jgi:ATP-dependent helicase/DNAse subunit B
VAVSITLITGPANAGKAQIVLDALRAYVNRGEDPLLIVPTDADQARYRRELADSGLALGARVERFDGLLGEICRRAGSNQLAISPLVRERVLAALTGARPGYASALAQLIAELEIRRVTPARLRAGVAALTAAGESQDGEESLKRLLAVFEGYQQTLQRIKHTDGEQRLTRALDTLRRTPSLWGSTPVLLYGFDDLTELQLDAIETLGGVVGTEVIVSLAYEPGRVVFAGRAGAFQRLLPLAGSHRELPARAEYYAERSRPALHHLERSLLSDERGRVATGGAVRLLEGSGPRVELELVAGEVRTLLEDGVAASEIAIVHRAPHTIAALLGEVLEDFEIPYEWRGPVRFAHTSIGRGLLGLLRCASGQGRLGDLLAWLRTPGMLERPELADGLEARARAGGAPDARRARPRWALEQWPLERIDRLRDAAASGSTVLIDALLAELQRLFYAPRRRSAAILDAEELHEARALAGARRALEELRVLARSAPALAPGAAELIELLEGLESTSGERPGADVVAVLEPLSLRARRVRMLFLCGMQEGVFPAPARSQPLLGEDERRRLAHASGLLLGSEPDALAAERYLLYALVSRPRERLTLSWHMADEDGAPKAPSLFVDDVCDLFEDDLREQTVRQLATAAVCIEGTRPPAIGYLRDERVLHELRTRRLWSASSLETWASCPVKWFVERMLRAEDLDPDPEPIARGGLAHAALKDTLEHLCRQTGSARLTPATLGSARRLLREALERHAEDFPLSVAPERVPGVRRRLQVDLERYLEHAAGCASALEPSYFELEFGFARESEEDDGEHERVLDEPGLAPLDLGEGVQLRGRIDRVDLAPDGRAVVYDYKGRAAPPSAKWLSEGSLQVALYMRAVEHLLGHAPAGGFYQPLAGRDMRARGLFDAESQLELDCVRTDRREHAEFVQLLEDCRAAALQAARQARTGALEPRPASCAYRGGCSYPTICRCER